MATQHTDVTIKPASVPAVEHSTHAELVNVVLLKSCQDQKCTFSTGLHLLVTSKTTSLERGNATAISYTWGEFDRRNVIVGHDKLGNIVKMQLGREWKTEEVVKTLANICAEEDGSGACWVDQLCIPQDHPELVRRIIGQIPSIYRSFDVIAMMPGRPCKCLGELLSTATSTGNKSEISIKTGS